jgi:predicted Zn-dependent protease
MATLQQKILTAVSLYVCLITAPLAQAKSALEATQIPQTSSIAQAAGDPAYQRAKKELSKDVYLVYRIIERLARANGLDDRPWRIGIVPTYDINAFAAEANLIAVFNGLLDQVDGDPDALACVLGHEMGHHTKRHQAVAVSERAKIYEKLKAEARAEAEAEAKNANRDSTNARVGGSAARAIGGLLGGTVGGAIGNIGGGALERESQSRVSRAEKRIEEIFAAKKLALQKQWKDLDHKQEFEADEQGYQLMVRAGFDPQGCSRMLSMLSQLSQTESQTHPATPERLEVLKKVAARQSVPKLVQEGKAKLAAHKQPLTYNLSRDGQSLRINSYRTHLGSID